MLMSASVIQQPGANFANWSESTIPSKDQPHLESIRQWIYTHTGLHFRENKQSVLYRRLLTLCWRLGLPNLGELDLQLSAGNSAQLAIEVACIVSTNHTFFFREPEVLRVFQQTILPELPADEVWRIWSAAAASGEEAYTVAMLMAETLGLEQAQQRAVILGTDISHPVIEQAEHGVYVDNRLEQVPDGLLKHYFQPAGLRQWRVRPELKQMCTFRHMNLQSAPWPFKQAFHVVLCRNILYYFDLQHQAQLVERIYDVTAPGGWLITSVTETLHGLHTRWQKTDAGIFRKPMYG
jgi:chemotaxis protein methyltransferase CheR